MTTATDPEANGFINVGEAIASRWPSALPQLPDDTVLQQLWASALQVSVAEDVIVASAQLLFDTECVLSVPGLDAVALAIAAADGGTLLDLEVTILPELVITLRKIPIALRLSAELLKPATKQPATAPDAPPQWVVDTTVDHVDIRLAEVTVSIDADGDVTFEADSSIDLPPCMIADSGVVVEAHDIGLHLSASDPPPGQPAGWKGLHLASASLYLPGELSGSVGTLSLTDAYIGNGGFTGAVTDTWTPTLSASLFGMDVTLAKAELDFVQNVPVTAALTGTITLPFFDQPVGVDLHLGLDGSIGVTVSAVQPAGATTSAGLLLFTKPDLLTLQLDSLGFQLSDGTFTALLSGTLTPLVGGLDWPGFHVQALSIDSEGNVHLDGGWLNLPSQYSLDFFGFHVAITKLGMGHSDDGGRWIGFSGSIKLVDGLSIGGSVDGLRFTWYDDGRPTALTLDGVGVELDIPGTLHFKGAVAYKELPGPEHRFDGDITLQLISLDLTVDGKIVIGTSTAPDGSTTTFFALYLAVELPAGIPLWSTGLGLYGIAGLMAIEMAPNKAPTEDWFENVDGSPGWYKRAPEGVTDLATKWDPLAGAFALGGGVTIGTIADNGFTFNGSLLLVISFPGPVILLEGKANLLKERAKLADNPIFRALLVLDLRAGNLTAGLDAKYRFGSGGELIDVGGSAEAYFDFVDASQWHVYLGIKDPKDKRIRAQVLSLFEADAYLMADTAQLQMGAWVGYDKHWKFGPLSVTVEAWLDGGAVLSRKPAYFHGELWLHGKAELKVFGFGLGLTVDARVAADVFDPYHVKGEFSVGISLPWPLPDFDADITLEWGPTPGEPALPIALKEIAVEHFKSTVSWPLPRGSLMLPGAVDAGDGFLTVPPPAAPLGDGPPADVPVVPMDARPHLTFGRAVHDDAGVGVNPNPPWPSADPPGWEWVGDPSLGEGPLAVRFAVKEVTLASWNGAAWVDVARKAATPNPAGVRELYGSWAPTPQLPSGTVAPGTDPPVGQVKLWLWSKTPFDYSRHGGSAWDEWFTDTFTGYPCIPPVPERTICCDFDGIPVGETVPLPSPCRHHREIVFFGTTAATVEELAAPSHGHTHALCWQGSGRDIVTGLSTNRPGLFGVVIFGNQMASKVVLVLDASKAKGTVDVIAVDVLGTQFGPFPLVGDTVTAEVKDLRAVLVRGSGHVCLVQVCVTFPPDRVAVNEAEDMAQRLTDSMALWGATGEVLDADTDYRLAVVTNVRSAPGTDPTGPPNHDLDVTELAYFRTEGPPALAQLSVPVQQPPGEAFDSGLDDLHRYVAQTVPVTVAADGQPPLLPRPVYRAYDVGVQFNEDYVDLLYRLAGRDLTVALYDANNRPVRDAEGRLMISANRWGATEALTLTASEIRYLTVIDGSTCVELDRTIIPHQVTLSSADPGQVLDPDVVYEARLVPLLMHEDFSAGLAGWTVVDVGTNQAPSQWTALGHPQLTGTAATASAAVVTLTGAGDLSALDPATDVVVLTTDTARASKQYRVVSVDNAAKQVTVDGSPALFGGSSAWTVPGWGAVLQSSNIWGGGVEPTSVPQPGTLLIGGDPAWTDLRVTILVRSSDDDGIGLVFRYQGPGDHYRYAMDRERRHRRLVRVHGGIYTVLAEDAFAYQIDSDYELTVEAVGPSLRVYQDGALVFDVADPAFTYGQIGAYCWANQGARFADVRVDDLGTSAVAAYGFAFTTSGYATFFHHMHSYQDDLWPAPMAAGDLAAATAAAGPAANPVTDTEVRAYIALAAAVLGSDADHPPDHVEAALLTVDGAPSGLLLRGPEPLDWTRTSLEVAHATGVAGPSSPPTGWKLSDVAHGTGTPNDETITVLARERASLAGVTVERLAIPESLAEPAEQMLFEDTFDMVAGVLLRERFGANALDAYQIRDAPGALNGPSQWSAQPDAIIQSAKVFAGNTDPAVPDKPGTVAIAGPRLADLRLTTVLRSAGDGAIGALVRVADDGSYYRFSMDHGGSYRRLVKSVGGVVTVLWEDAVAPDTGRSYELRIEAFGDLLAGWLDHQLLFVVRDGDVHDGQVGLYCWANDGARFEALEVQTLQTTPVLARPPLADRGQLTVADTGLIDAPSAWQATGGVVTQQAAINGTTALLAADYGDLTLALTMSSSADGAIGVVLRYADERNLVRFAMDRTAGRRSLIAMVDGFEALLWQDHVAFDLDREFALTVTAQGGRLQGWLDGDALFDVVAPAGARNGQVGLWTSRTAGARFRGLVIGDPVARVGAWTIVDDAATSQWRSGSAALVQQVAVGDSSSIPAPGTTAVAGSDGWADVRVSATLRNDGVGAIGFAVRWRDPANFYRLAFDAQHGYRRFLRMLDGVPTVLWQDAVPVQPGTAVPVTIDAVGARFVARVGEQVLFDLTDEALGTGRIGLYTAGDDGARFAQVMVTRPPLDARARFRDNFGQGDMSAWTIVDEGDQSTPSHWAVDAGALAQTSNIYSNPLDGTAIEKRGTLALAGDPAWTDTVVRVTLTSTDDDAIGVVLRYAGPDDFYRFSMDRERGYRRLVRCVGGTFATLWEDTAGYDVGRPYELVLAAVGTRLTGWLDGVPLLEAEDPDGPAAGRIGLYCWANVGARFAGVRVFGAEQLTGSPLASDDFDWDSPGTWRFETAGTQDGPAVWSVTDGELRQTSKVGDGTDDGADLAKPGTVALTGDNTWRDYRTVVRLRSDTADAAIGAVVRYAGPGDFYRFSMDAQRGYRRLVKVVGGVVTELWSDTAVFPIGRDCLLTLDAVGDGLTGYLDGLPVFAVRDPDLAAGAAGCYCWHADTARFASFRALAADWIPHIRFSAAEPVLAAGTRIVVHSGNAADWTAPPVPGVADRFLATLGDPGRCHLPPTTSVALRVRDALGALGHARVFLPDSAYTPLPGATVLRRADGLDVAIFPTGGPGLDPGELRLRLIYRRDNTAADPASTILSQAGDHGDEEVTLRVPITPEVQ